MEPTQAYDTRPPGAPVITPQQIAAHNGYTPPPNPPAPVYTPPAQAAPPMYTPPAQPDFSIGGPPQSPEALAAENQKLRTQMARDAVFNAAGGEQRFMEFSRWAATNRPAQANKQLTEVLNNPNIPSHVRATYVQAAMAEFDAASKSTGSWLQGDAGIPVQTQPAMDTQAISRDAFRMEYMDLRQAGKTVNSPEVQALEARRLAGIKAGLK